MIFDSHCLALWSCVSSPMKWGRACVSQGVTGKPAERGSGEHTRISWGSTLFTATLGGKFLRSKVTEPCCVALGLQARPHIDLRVIRTAALGTGSRAGNQAAWTPRGGLPTGLAAPMVLPAPFMSMSTDHSPALYTWSPARSTSLNKHYGPCDGLLAAPRP